MRVTNKMTTASVLRSLSRPLESMFRRQAEIATGKRLQKPSDDPAAVSELQGIETELRGIEQYKRNITSAQSLYRASESALADYGSLLVRAKELTVQAGNGTLDVTAREAMAAEVDGLLESVLALGNQRSQDRYLFGGTNTKDEPFRAARDSSGKIVSVTPGDISASIARDVDEETTMAVNVPGDMVFSGDANIFETLIQLRDAIRSNDQPVVLGALDRLEGSLTASLDARAVVGASLERLDSVQNQLENREIGLQQRSADLSDVDIAEAVTQLQADEVAYQAAAGAASRILGMSLVDFLR